jgi:hypothetical protein
MPERVLWHFLYYDDDIQSLLSDVTKLQPCIDNRIWVK